MIESCFFQYSTAAAYLNLPGPRSRLAAPLRRSTWPQRLFFAGFIGSSPIA
jgi:hypothetical protein